MASAASLKTTVFQPSADKLFTATVNGSPMTNRDHQHHNLLIAYLTQKTIIPDTIAPQIRQVTLNRFAEVARVLTAFNAFSQPIEQPLLHRSIKPSQLPLSKITDLNRPGQDRALIH